jgi:hypothetical protein
VADHRRSAFPRSTAPRPCATPDGMAIFLGLGTFLLAAFMAIRLLPKLVGLAFWLGSSAITGGAALAILYLLSQGR